MPPNPYPFLASYGLLICATTAFFCFLGIVPVALAILFSIAHLVGAWGGYMVGHEDAQDSLFP